MKANLPSSNLPRIVIVGGGFGGITLAQKLNKLPFQVVMLDQHNYHTFQPLLYQVATGGLEPDSIAFPLRKMFGKRENFHFRMAKVEGVDREQRVVNTTLGPIQYDYLVLATGSATNFFGNEKVETYSNPMKSVPEALDLRSLILQNFEQTHETEITHERDILMDFIIVGGGPTGVEMAGALAELKRHVLPHDYPELDFEMMDIHLMEGGDRLLAGMSEKSSADAKRALEKMGVNVHLNTLVTDFDGTRVKANTDLELEAATVIWAAGVKGNVPKGFEGNLIARGNRLKVDEYQRLVGHDHIFAVGDLAYMETENWPKGHPQVAPAAMQMGKHLGDNFKRLAKGAPLEKFHYFDKGTMATIGRNKAVLDFRKLHMNGILAWLGWMFVHIFYLIGFRNKAVVFINWVWSYFTYDKGTRLIIRPFKRKKTLEEQEKELEAI